MVAALLRDVFGSPYRPVTLAWDEGRLCEVSYAQHGFHPPTSYYDPVPWLTPTVAQLARRAYDDRLPDGLLDPVLLMVLADALEESGCCEAAILAHLREAGPHARGCHAVDSILGRS